MAVQEFVSIVIVSSILMKVAQNLVSKIGEKVEDKIGEFVVDLIQDYLVGPTKHYFIHPFRYYPFSFLFFLFLFFCFCFLFLFFFRQYFDAIGVYAKPISERQKNEKGEPGCLEGCTSMGPWGGPGGSKFSFCVKGGIKQIVIAHGVAIDSIIFKGDNGDGVLEESDMFGGNGGSKTTIDIDWPKEYITGISGSYGTFYSGGPVTVTSLCFITNHTKYGPFGIHQGTSFSSTPMEGGGIIGFHGLCGLYFDAIGVYAKPTSECQKNEKGEHSCLEGCISMGPWGGPGGGNFRFFVKGGIKQIVIAHGVFIDSIIFKGDNGDGVLEESNKFGGNGGDKTDKIDIAWPEEYLTSISGSYETFNSGSLVLVVSLCFITNRAKYGPVGTHRGTSFSSIPMEGGGIIGFHGCAGPFINAIGVYAKPMSECQKIEKVLKSIRVIRSSIA